MKLWCSNGELGGLVNDFLILSVTAEVVRSSAHPHKLYLHFISAMKSNPKS